MKELNDKGLGLAAISYDSREILAAFAKQRGITFPLLSDVGSATIKRYGILNTIPDEALGPNGEDPAVKADVRRYVSAGGTANRGMVGIPFPGTFILDRQGRVQSRFFEDVYSERYTVASVMLKTGAAAPPVAALKVSGPQLTLTTYPSDPSVAPGNRFTLVLQIAPLPRMHVYAPGASSYRVVAVRVDEQPFLRVLPLKYPDSEMYFFAPLKERVPVYQKPFTLLQEVVLEASPQAQAALRGKEALTITGSLDYQACDDKICYNPASVPLTWAVGLRPLITERPRVDSR